MLRFKLFVGDAAEVESAVNSWLTEYEPEITHMTQTANGGSVVISFVFDESFRAQELRLSEERGMSNSTGPAIPADSIPDKPIIVPQEPGYYPPDARE